MRIKNFLPLLLSVAYLFIISCKDEPAELGIELISSELVTVKTFDSQTEPITQSSSQVKRVVPLGAASNILIGKYQDTEASTLLKFIFGLADSLKQDILDDSINVLDAWVTLTNRYVFGDTLSSMEFTVHKINSTWDVNTFTIDSLPLLDFETDDLSSNPIDEDTLYTFHIDTDLILSWMKNSADINIESNEGIYLKPTISSGKVVGYQALTTLSADAAELTVVIEKTGVYTDTTVGFILSDMSIVDGSLPVLPAGSFGVQASIAANVILAFDLSIIPANIVINKAELILTKDTINTVTGSTFNNSLDCFFLSDSSALDLQDGSGLVLSPVNNTFVGNITSYIRQWVNNNNNQGMLLSAGSNAEGLELFALFGSTSSSISNRPRIRIVYTEKY